MGSFDQPSQVRRDNMGNTAARQRLKAQDFAYISRNTAFLSRDIVSDYYTELMSRCPDGKMEQEEFKKIFRLAFPERPEDKLELLTTKVANVEKTDGKIPLHTIGMLLYLFCDGKTEDNIGQVIVIVVIVLTINIIVLLDIVQMFNLFDEDGNGSIN